MNKQTFTTRAMVCERRLYRIARTLLRCDADCEDAVQEALLKAWSKRNTLREEQYFETWLVRILINECKTVLRRRPVNTEPLNESLAAPAADPQVMNALIFTEDEGYIFVAMEIIEPYGSPEDYWAVHVGGNGDYRPLNLPGWDNAVYIDEGGFGSVFLWRSLGDQVLWGDIEWQGTLTPEFFESLFAE